MGKLKGERAHCYGSHARIIAKLLRFWQRFCNLHRCKNCFSKKMIFFSGGFLIMAVAAAAMTNIPEMITTATMNPNLSTLTEMTPTTRTTICATQR